MRIKLIFSLILLILAVIFALQNSNAETVKFLFWEATLPVALIIIISLTVGAILGLIYSIPGKKPEKSDKFDDHKPEDKPSGLF
jgi:putative membrane protein